jgi:membrane protein DedA with SNARE-associated domain
MSENFGDITWSEWLLRTHGVAYIRNGVPRTCKAKMNITYLLVCLVPACLFGHSSSYYSCSYLLWEILEYELRFLEWFNANFPINWGEMLKFQTQYTEWPKKMYTHFDMKNITL